MSEKKINILWLSFCSLLAPDELSADTSGIGGVRSNNWSIITNNAIQNVDRKFKSYIKTHCYFSHTTFGV